MPKEIGDIGESLFEELCDFHSWTYDKIPTKGVRTPDYTLGTVKGNFIAEVSVVNGQGPKYGEVRSISVGKAVRHKIKKKKAQLECSKLNTLLVLTGDSVQLTYESVTAAMYGDLTFEVGMESGKVKSCYYGKNAKMRPKSNTVFGAIAVMSRAFKKYRYKGEESYEPSLIVYHNMYSEAPFSKNFFKNYQNVYEVFYEQT